MSHDQINSAERLARKAESLAGKKALLEEWELYKGATFYDAKYVAKLRARIKQSELRILNGY
jgi:hypothetical protein